MQLRELWRGGGRTAPAYGPDQAGRDREALREILDLIPPAIHIPVGGSAGELRLAALLTRIRSTALGRVPDVDSRPAPDQVIEAMEKLLAATRWRRIEALSDDGGGSIVGFCVDGDNNAWNWRPDSDGTPTLIREQP